MNNQSEILRVMEAMKGANDRRTFERYQTIYLYIKGYKQKEISDITLRSPKTISTYINAYKKEGIDGLKMKHSSGAPHKLTDKQKQELVQVVTHQTPMDVGLSTTYNWTLSLVAQYIAKEWGEKYTLRGISRLLETLGLRHTRPTYTRQRVPR
ncbi:MULTISPECIES: helix-turn-helix domain-containing protein [unclassified Bacillus (in: firmicutes)]|nr:MULTISPECIES: helix-turn-helix domain-containing protein [unclassified Bacillus (in: firmicutes)]MBT2618537.1 transposase [Bacillus sp. ISL-78]MBT2632227.1 transposase [Bacillus sp. ISL-101]